MLNDEQLKIKDLCAKFPYGLIVSYIDAETNETVITKLFGVSGTRMFDQFGMIPDNLKALLRPLSSMSDEEKVEYNEACLKDKESKVAHYASDWCDEHHFDQRGLIEKGLAIETGKRIYKNN